MLWREIAEGILVICGAVVLGSSLLLWNVSSETSREDE